MNRLDQLTIELLTNKKHFNKYLSNNDPEKYEIEMTRQHQINKYRSRIVNLVNEILFNQEFMVSNELQTPFNQFLDACFNHFESIDLNETNDDTLFPYEESETVLLPDADERLNIKNDNPVLNNLDIYLTNKSFWGNNIKKINTKP